MGAKECIKILTFSGGLSDLALRKLICFHFWSIINESVLSEWWVRAGTQDLGFLTMSSPQTWGAVVMPYAICYKGSETGHERNCV